MNFGTRSFKEASGAGVDRPLDGRLEWTKFDHATALAAAIAYITLQQGDRVGLGVFADELLAHRATARASGAPGARSSRRSRPHPVDDADGLGRVVDQVLGKLNNRCLIVSVSDFFEDPAALRESLWRGCATAGTT
jgi:uncharacterized protein (DUF58 family)